MVIFFKKISEKYFFSTPLFYSFGNASEEVLWAYARSRVLGRKLIIIAPMKYTQLLSYSICNSELFKLDFGFHLNFIEKLVKYLLTIAVNLNFFLKRAWALTLKTLIKHKLPEHYYFPLIGKTDYWPYHTLKNGELTKYEEDLILKEIQTFPPPLINLRNCESEYIKFNDLTKKLRAKYVCLHVRDDGFHCDSNKRPYRNATINNYIPAIEMLIEQGLAVVRLGDKSMQPCEIKNEKYFEYCLSDQKSELLDLLLIKNCEFYIGMQSGPLDMAQLFRKPVLLLNMYLWFFACPMKRIDRGLLKRMVIPDYGAINELKQRFELPYEFTDWRRRFENDEVLYIENSPAEILKATKEFYKDYCTCFTREPNAQLILNQSRYKKYAKENLKMLFEKNNKFDDEDNLNLLSRTTYRVLSEHGFIYCNSSFLD